MPQKRATDPLKHCGYCNAVLTRKVFDSGRLEDMGVFKRRKYCNQVCMGNASLKENAGDSALHKRAQKHIKTACERCGTGERLQVHHLDSNPSNNAPSNLVTLCVSCHTKWHWENGKTNPKRQSECVVCGRPARKLDMCEKHYVRFKKYGDPNITKQRVGLKYVLVRDDQAQT